MAVKAEAFLALEKSLTDRLQDSWSRIFLQVSGQVQSLLEDGKVPEAYEAAYALSLDSIVTDNLPSLKYLAYSALFFGASRLSKRESVRDAMIGSVNLEPTINQTIKLLSKFIQFNLTFQLQRKLLQVISEYQAAKPDTLFGESEKGALKVKKEEQPTLSQEFVSFRKEGDRMLQLISSLHTSRVSAYGFTVEADILGVQEYAVSEQLDNRICPVCRVMHGKTFKVRDATDSLNNILTTEDPEMLKIVQPWPKQNPDSVQWLSELSEAQLVQRNWHIPPYHPNCRGLLVHVGKVPRIEDTPSFQAAMGQMPPPGPVLSTPEDFLAFANISSMGASRDQEAARMSEYWNRYGKGEKFQDTVANLLGLSQEELMILMREGADNGYFPLSISISDVFSGSPHISIGYTGSKYGTLKDSRFSFYINPKEGDAYISFVKIQDTLQGKGILKQVLRSWVPILERLGITRIKLEANIDVGGYAWAKYGWEPDTNGSTLIKLVSQLRNKLTQNTAASRAVFASEPIRETVYDLLDMLAMGDTKALWALSDIPKVGKLLLQYTDWEAVLDLSNALSRSRFMNYIGAVR